MTERVHRDVVSFVRRSARMNPSQQKAWDNYSADLVVPITHGQTSTSVAAQPPLTWGSIFGRDAPLVVESGSGNGDSLVPMAAALPQVNLVAFEVFEPAVASTLAKIARLGLANVRIVMADGAQGLSTLFEEQSVSELWTFFADPWHKARHHKRRLVNPDLAATVAGQLEPGGHWRLATDWQDYAEWIREVLDHAPGLTNVHLDEGGWAPRWQERPVTKYEQRGLDAGRRLHDLTDRVGAR